MEKKEIEEISEKTTEELTENAEDLKENAQEVKEELEEASTELVEATDDLNKILEEDGIVSFESSAQIDQTKMELLAKDIDIHDPHSVIFFGSQAQENINRVSESMLEGVKNKDLGSAGDSLNNLVAAIKGFDVDSLNPNVKQGFFSKIFGLASPIQKFIGRYEDVRGQVDAVTDELEQHKTQLLTDITSLDRLYDVNFDYFKELELYIAAGGHAVTTKHKTCTGK